MDNLPLKNVVHHKQQMVKNDLCSWVHPQVTSIRIGIFAVLDGHVTWVESLGSVAVILYERKFKIS